MRVKIIKKGAFDKDGARVEVGKVLKIEGETMPSHLVGKAIDLDAMQDESEGDTAKQPVTNPAKRA